MFSRVCLSWPPLIVCVRFFHRTPGRGSGEKKGTAVVDELHLQHSCVRCTLLLHPTQMCLSRDLDGDYLTIYVCKISSRWDPDEHATSTNNQQRIGGRPRQVGVKQAHPKTEYTGFQKLAHGNGTLVFILKIDRGIDHGILNFTWPLKVDRTAVVAWRFGRGELEFEPTL